MLRSDVVIKNMVTSDTLVDYALLILVTEYNKTGICSIEILSCDNVQLFPFYSLGFIA
jgi:hypothetical protein